MYWAATGSVGCSRTARLVSLIVKSIDASVASNFAATAGSSSDRCLLTSRDSMAIAATYFCSASRTACSAVGGAGLAAGRGGRELGRFSATIASCRGGSALDGSFGPGDVVAVGGGAGDGLVDAISGGTLFGVPGDVPGGVPWRRITITVTATAIKTSSIA